jgi:transposase
LAKPILDDDLWEVVRVLLPAPRGSKQWGRPRVSDRATLSGILFVLKTGIPWRFLPQEMGCGSGVSCWRRLRDGQKRGVWARIHRILLARLRPADELDGSRAAIDSSRIRAVGAGEKRVRTPRIGLARAASTLS